MTLNMEIDKGNSIVFPIRITCKDEDEMKKVFRIFNNTDNTQTYVEYDKEEGSKISQDGLSVIIDVRASSLEEAITDVQTDLNRADIHIEANKIAKLETNQNSEKKSNKKIAYSFQQGDAFVERGIDWDDIRDESEIQSIIENFSLTKKEREEKLKEELS